MIQKESLLWVGDNSDAIKALCIHPNKKNNKHKKTSLANFVKATIKKRVSRRKNIKRRVNWFLVGSTAKRVGRKSGDGIRFARTKLVLVDEKQKKTLGTRIKGVLPREISAAGVPDIVLRARRLV